jgi:acyl-CoA synthetase (AMP-forming)/AMP-acid ligase II
MTELSPLCSYLPAEDHVTEGTPEQLKRLKSAGVPIFTAEEKVLDEDDNEVPRGEVGQICARGPMVMKGYWKQPEATAEALRNGWMHTGDAGYMDEDGYIYLVDRTKDMIVTGGENVYSVEVEAALYEHPAVLEAAVIGIPDDQWGEAVHAVVHLKPKQTATDEELIHHCHQLIANYKCPKSITFSTSELPKSGAGKILKRDLRAPFWEGQERLIH